MKESNHVIRPRTILAPLAAASLLALVTTSLGYAQASDPAPVKPATTPAPSTSGSKAAPPASDPGKSLDDVLGIPASKSGSKSGSTSSGTRPGATEPPATGDATSSNDAAPALDKAKERVEQALDEKAVEDLMRQALGGMRVSADRLANETDPGLGTQRVQQDVIAKLDTLIEEAKKRCKGGQCKSSSSSSCNNPSQSQSKQASKPGEKEGAKTAQKPGDSKTRKEPSKNASRADGMVAGAEPPAVDPTDEAKLLDESQTEWGKLPERVRDLIRQGSRDRIASIYQRLTEEYYRRMAEDASR